MENENKIPLRDTDLAAERKRAPREKGVRYKEGMLGDIRLTALTVTEDAEDARLPVGRTLSLALSPALLWTEEEREAVICALRLGLQFFFSPLPERLLVVGLGNRRLMLDCLGPLTAERVEASAALPALLKKCLTAKESTSIAVFQPDVFSKTGIESGQAVKAAVGVHSADAVLAIDALAARDPSRIFRVIEITDTGTVPGSGVGNGTLALTEKVLGVPVISIGVPVVARAGGDCFTVLRSTEDEQEVVAALLSAAINLHFGGVPPLSDGTVFSLFSP